MYDWSEIKGPFRDTLISEFDWDNLRYILMIYCNRRLDVITSRYESLINIVDNVIDDAMRNGWLEELAQGALEEYPGIIGLQETVPHILEGVESEGKAYYQGSDWEVMKGLFREALISGYDWHRLRMVLIYHCDRRLDRISSENEGFGKNVDDVIEDAVQNGWLEKLAEGALAENPTNLYLKTSVPHIVDGIASEGKAYYQGTDWGVIKSLFREALISGFNRNGLEKVLRIYCDRRLDSITSRSKGLDENVDDVIDDAVRNGWLEDLAKGALTENPMNTQLRTTVPHILEGVAAEGKAYYQQTGRASVASPEPDMRELHWLLVDLFNLEELATFSSFNLGVNFDDLGGSGKPAKARELVLFMQRRGKLDLLIRELQMEVERRQG